MLVQVPSNRQVEQDGKPIKQRRHNSRFKPRPDAWLVVAQLLGRLVFGKQGEELHNVATLRDCMYVSVSERITGGKVLGRTLFV